MLSRNLLRRISVRCMAFFREQDGPTAVEYAVMLGLIIGVCFASINSLSSATSQSFEDSAQAINDAIE